MCAMSDKNIIAYRLLLKNRVKITLYIFFYCKFPIPIFIRGSDIIMIQDLQIDMNYGIRIFYDEMLTSTYLHTWKLFLYFLSLC